MNAPALIEVVPLPKVPPINMDFRRLVTALEKKIMSLPGAMIGDCFPLKHSFAEGVYIRELIIPKGMFCVGKLHKDSYVNCFMKGDMTILTEEGIKRIKGPATIVSPAGCKRFGFSHEEVVWVTVHPNPTNDMNIDRLEKEIHVDDYDDLPNQVIDTEKVDEIFHDFVDKITGFDVEAFRALTKKVFAHEKPGLWSDWTEEQQVKYMSGDWESFSRSRGYTEEEINDLRLWIDLKESAESNGYNALESIQDLSAEVALKSISSDKHNEVLKSSHIPTSKKVPYKEVVCQV